MVDREDSESDWQEDSRRKTWLDRFSGVAGNLSILEKQFVRGVRALQKLAVPDGRLLDYQEARTRLEKTALELRGQDRLDCIHRWVEPVIITQPASPDLEKQNQEEEEDWQQLSALTSDSASSSNQRHSSVAASLYLDHRDPSAEPMGFRELFLRSSALENLLAGYSEQASSSNEEEELLSSLVNACLGSSEQENEMLLADLLSIARAQGQSKENGVSETDLQFISGNVAKAVTDLKRQAASEVVVIKMRSLRGEIASQAASAARLHKFNSGASEPSGEVTRQRLLQGLLATQEVMVMSDALCKMAEQQTVLAGKSPAVQHPSLLDELQNRSAGLATAVSEAEVSLEENQSQKRESQSFKDQKLEEMEAADAKIQKEISGLQNERAVILAQLEKIELALTKAQAAKADLLEGRVVLEEGSNFTIQGLEHKADELCNLQNQHEAEMASLTKCRQLICRSHLALGRKRQEDQRVAAKAVIGAAQDFTHAATRHLYFQRAQLQLLLRQLTFCAAELTGLTKKLEHVTSLGMDTLLEDVATQRQRLLQQYSEAEAASMTHLDQVEQIWRKVTTIRSQAALAEAGEELPESIEFEDLSKSILSLKEVFKNLKRPGGLPAPGEKLRPATKSARIIQPVSSEQSAGKSAYSKVSDEVHSPSPSTGRALVSQAEVAEDESPSSIGPSSLSDSSSTTRFGKLGDQGDKACDSHNDLGLDTLLSKDNDYDTGGNTHEAEENKAQATTLQTIPSSEDKCRSSSIKSDLP